jgi:dihydrofolate reductase
MGKATSLINTTPDGFADSLHAHFDEPYYEFWFRLLTGIDTIAFGRNTFEIFQRKWPERLRTDDPASWRGKLAKKMNDLPKLVYSSSLTTTTWNNAAIVASIDADYIQSYKRTDKAGLLFIGSPGLVTSLTKLKLIDEYYFCIQPMLTDNGGVRLFENIKPDAPLPLKFINSQHLDSGVHIIHYQNANP